jgi:chromosome segregation ATPase
VPTKEELQDEVDELRLELERTRNVAESEVAELREEVSTLREELATSESRRRQFQSELEALSEATAHLRESYAQREERLLGRLSDEARRMAEAGERWAAEKAELLEQLEAQHLEVVQQATRAGNYHKQVLWQLEEMARLRRGASEEEEEIALRDKKIENLEIRIERMREDAESQKRPFLIELAALLGSRLGCWVAMAFLIGILAGLTYIVNSIIVWLRPSENLLGR